MSLFERLAARNFPDPGLSRRTLLQVGAAAGGGLLVGFLAPVGGAEGQEDVPKGGFAPNAFIRIDPASNVTLVMPQVEMGQGTYTSISMILAEELDADWSKVSFEHAPPNDALYANPMLRPAGDRQLQLHPRLLDAAAQGRGRRADNAGRGRGDRLGRRRRPPAAPKPAR